MRRVWVTGGVMLLTVVAGRAVQERTPIYNSEREPGKPMAAAEAAASFRAPPGFRVTAFAAEPDLQNPIALTFDRRGRLWIAENYTYAEREKRFDLRLYDRILIFEEGPDGRFKSRKVFADDLQMLTSIEVGHGGVWAMCPPQLLFLADAKGNDKPDGGPEVVLDGFTVPQENYHNFANGLRWGPDGWLYGRCGASAPGLVGAPGTPAAQRIPLHGGVWRYHPQRKTFEVLCHGTTNPWGHDWNALGEAFFVNTVNGHLWHVIPGAHFVRPHTIDPNPHAYQAIDQHADHWHWDTAKDWSDSRKVTGEHDRRGGGHAHSGTMVYLADQWPAEYRGKLLTLNFHGRRANVERLERQGSGYVGKHDPDMLFAADTWFRGIDLAFGPDGGVFVLDWSDTGECHENTGVHRLSGRIFKVTHGTPKPVEPFDLVEQGGRNLAAMHRHPNEWFVRQARLELAGRAAYDHKLTAAHEILRGLVARGGDAPQRLRALWTEYAIGGADAAFLRPLLKDSDEAVRTWAIRLLTDRLPLDTIFGKRPGPDVPLDSDLLSEFARMAKADASGLVRLALASTLQRLPLAQRPALAAPLLARAEDAQDHNLPLLLWYGLMPLGDTDPAALARLAPGCALPATRTFIARRLAEEIATRPEPLNQLLEAAATADAAFQADLLKGLAAGLRGWRKAPKPAAWDAFAARVAPSPALRDLNVLFGDGRALDEVKRLALDDKADLETRRAALQALIAARPPDLRAVCEKLLKVRFLNTTAVQGLALFDDPALGVQLAKSYKAFHPSERPAVIETLITRPAFARALLDQMAAGQIPKGDLSAFQARQVQGLGDAAVTERLETVWGKVRESAAEKKAQMAALKARLTPAVLAAADKGKGRVVFQQACASCHKLYGQGADIGPDLTGAGRDNLDYLLENILDPSAVVNADYRMTRFALEDGRVLDGQIKARTPQTVTVQLVKEVVVLRVSDVTAQKPSDQSLMPDGLLNPLTPDQVRDLFAYLMHRAQVPLPAGAATGSGP